MQPFRKKNIILFHLLFWALVFGVWYFLRYEDYAQRSIAFTVTAIKVGDLALMVYITNYIFLPRLLYNRKYGWFALAFTGLVVTSSIIKMQVLAWVTGDQGSVLAGSSVKQRIYDNVIPHFFLVVAGAAIQLMLDYRRLQQRLAETAREKAEAELNFLKSQINPHFLFNSLNTVYFLIDKQNGPARRALHQFSDMLRYQLYELNGDKVPIERELQFLRDYFALQRLRKNTGYELHLKEGGDLKGFGIEPLLLIPFVENAFKHISHFTDRKNFVTVELYRENGRLQFTAANSCNGQPGTEPGGIGLVNVKRRLELLYPGKHELTISKNEETYRVELVLDIRAGSAN